MLLSKRRQENHYVARFKHYIFLVPRMESGGIYHASRENIHASRKIMLCDKIFMHHGKIMHRELIFMHHGKSCIACWYSCIVQNHASQKIMHGEKIFMVCEKESSTTKNSCIARRHSCIAKKVVHCERSCIATWYSCIAKNHALWEDIHALKKRVVHYK